jgi:Lrp/AsnC family transcriptional regulator, leucine-responsive regulatory protein
MQPCLEIEGDTLDERSIPLPSAGFPAAAAAGRKRGNRENTRRGSPLQLDLPPGRHYTSGDRGRGVAMTSNAESLLDNVGWQLLRVLQDDSRLSYSELGRRVGLSSPAVAERVRRMEDLGIINGYTAAVDTAKLGYPTMAFIHLKAIGEHHAKIATVARTLSEILECHHVTGQDSYMIKVVVSSMPHLEHIISQLRHYGETTTSIVLSSPVKGKPILSGPSVRLTGQMPPIAMAEGQ